MVDYGNKYDRFRVAIVGRKDPDSGCLRGRR